MSAPSFTAAEQPPPQLLFLPDELVIAVLRRVRAADLCRLGRTCRRLHALADIDELWAPIALGLYQPNLNRKQQQIQSHSQQANVRYQNVRQGHETALPAHQSTDAPSNAVENAPTPIAVCDPVAAPSLALSLPAREFKRFLTSLARSQRCFRCGVDESGRETGGFADSIAEKFKRRYCKLCQTTELVTRTDAKSRYMLTNKQLARLTSVTKPWYSKDCNLYLKSHVESLAEQRRESGLVLGSAARMCSSISPSSCEDPTTLLHRSGGPPDAHFATEPSRALAGGRHQPNLVAVEPTWILPHPQRRSGAAAAGAEADNSDNAWVSLAAANSTAMMEVAVAAAMGRVDEIDEVQMDEEEEEEDEGADESGSLWLSRGTMCRALSVGESSSLLSSSLWSSGGQTMDLGDMNGHDALPCRLDPENSVSHTREDRCLDGAPSPRTLKRRAKAMQGLKAEEMTLCDSPVVKRKTLSKSSLFVFADRRASRSCFEEGDAISDQEEDPFL